MRILVIAAAVVAVTAQASPLDVKEVSAAATWVVHVDFDAMRDSTVALKAYGKLLDCNKDVRWQIAFLRAMIGVDVKKDLHGLTLYGATIGGKKGGVFVFHLEVNRELLLQKLKQSPDYKMSNHGPHQVHSWTDSKGKKDEHPLAGAFHGPAVVVLAATVGDVETALDVMDGELPALYGSDSPLAEPAPPGTILTANAEKLATAELPFKSPLVTESEVFHLAAGEHEGESFLLTRLVTKSPDVAEQVKAIVEGLRAMAELQRRSDQATSKLLHRIKLGLADRAVNAEFRAPAGEVWAQIEKEWDLSIGKKKSP